MTGRQKRYCVYIGLGDKSDRTRRISDERAVSLIGGVCRNYKAGFSVICQKGGYFHENGEYIQENSLVLSIVGVSKRLVNEIAEDICCFLGQECVMITCERVSVAYVKRNISFQDERK